MFQHIAVRYLFFIALSIASFLFLKQGAHSGLHFPHIDKFAHFGVFFILALLFEYSFSSSKLDKIALLSIYGFLIELLQSFLPYRSASFADWLADVTGVVAFYVIYYFGFQKRQAQ